MTGFKQDVRSLGFSAFFLATAAFLYARLHFLAQGYASDVYRESAVPATRTDRQLSYPVRSRPIGFSRHMLPVLAALTAQRLLGESPAWALLRADNAPVAFGILGARFSRQHRQVPPPELMEVVDRIFDLLRDRGFDLPQSAPTMCAPGWPVDTWCAGPARPAKNCTNSATAP